MKRSTILILVCSILLVLILQTLGFTLAAHKPLWNDELFSQTYTINGSYADILSGKNKAEGNRSPLFYIQQKLFCDIFHYQTPQPWLQGHWDYVDPFANMFLRILPVSWMTSFFLLVFLYFSFRFNILFGFLGLFMGLTSIPLWLLWPEARPYGLWVLLTGFQMILFLEILLDKSNKGPKWLYLSLVNVFLSLTCILSIFQIGIVCAMLLFKERRWHQYVLPLAVPLFFIFLYKPPASSNGVNFILTVQQTFSSVIPINQLCILLFYPILVRLYSLQNRKLFPRVFLNDQIMTILPFFLGISLLIMAIYLFLTVLKSHAAKGDQYILFRHIIFLIPVSIIGTTCLSGLIWKNLKTSWWIRISILTVVLGLLLFHINIVWGKIYYLYTNNLYT